MNVNVPQGDVWQAAGFYVFRFAEVNKEDCHFSSHVDERRRTFETSIMQLDMHQLAAACFMT